MAAAKTKSSVAGGASVVCKNTSEAEALGGAEVAEERCAFSEDSAKSSSASKKAAEVLFVLGVEGGTEACGMGI